MSKLYERFDGLSKGDAMSVVISLHGIRIRGVWQNDLMPELALAGLVPYVLDYGQFGALQVPLTAVGPEAGPAIAFNHMREVMLNSDDLQRLRESMDLAAPWHRDLKWALLLPVPTVADSTRAAAVVRFEGLDPRSPELLENGLIKNDTVTGILRRLGANLNVLSKQRKAS